MERLVASIVHLTDLHLFVDENGEQADLGEINRSVKLFWASTKVIRLKAYRDQIQGFALHNNEAWDHLQTQLPEIIRQEREEAGDAVPIIVAQTGDVETFGRRMTAPPGTEAFPGFKYLRDALWPASREAGATVWFDLYGNHDVWAGTFPMLTPFTHTDNAFRAIAEVPQLAGTWPDRFDLEAPGECRIEFYRVNSVAPDAIHGSLAAGIIGPHPPGTQLPCSRSLSAMEELDCFAAKPPKTGASDRRVVRILTMHHPPHLFRPTRWVTLTSGRVIGVDRLAERAQELPVQLVLAGHRHKLDPDRGVVHRGNAPDANQQPLPARTGQLAAASPTQSYSITDVEGRNSFSLYRLFVDVVSDHLRVSRTVFSYRDARQRFDVDRLGERDVFRDIPL